MEGKTKEQLAIEYEKTIDNWILTASKLDIRQGSLNQQERALIVGERATGFMAAFEDNPNYPGVYNFITAYKAQEKAYNEFLETGNFGLSAEEKAAKTNLQQQIVAAHEKAISDQGRFFKSLQELCPEGLMSHDQVRKAEEIYGKLDAGVPTALTKKESKLLTRYDKREQHKVEFCENHPDIDENNLI